MKDDKWLNKKITRRDMLKITGAGVLGAAIGASGFGGVMKAMERVSNVVSDNPSSKNKVNFYGSHQPGISTPVQKHIYFASLNVTLKTPQELKELFQNWTPIIVRLMNGEQIEEASSNQYIPPVDTGEAEGLNANNLTITVGVGPSLFKKLNIEHVKPKELEDLPHFPKDQLQDEYTGGDLCIQACADDPQVAFHAVRNLIRQASGKVQIHWTQAGFNSFPSSGGTPRNLFAFKDGTVNPKTEKEYKDVVWCDSGWMKNGTYLIVRKIQMHLETWDRTSLKDQETTFGRYRDSGAPIGKKDEFDDFDIEEKDEKGNYLIPEVSHVHLARKSGAKILRRAFSFASGIIDKTGAYDAGLLFIAFQKSPQQFITIQNTLGRQDKLNEYITHRGSGIFACFPGVKEGGYLGETLFNSL